MKKTEDSIPSFTAFALSEPIQESINAVGYETPSPIQAATIPIVLEGRDLIGQAQTGTGKTAAFALPLLSRIDLSNPNPQVLVLTPTRELTIQVAEAMLTYASKLEGFHILPVYGGQSYGPQLHQLKRGVHVVVGTPGRVMDHIRRKTLKLDALQCLVLDEADEMLRMGFIEDVEWILGHTPETRQIALFSATMPTPVRRIADRYLKDPEHITIKVKTSTAATIAQRYWMVSGVRKINALTRILDAEPFDGMIIFVRTKNATSELSSRLEARGYASAPINGDLSQTQRERTIQQLKNGKLDILVATDVAARGLDVERITHVVNYDIPGDTESYVHRVGRTGRAGREGQAILFVTPREKRMLQAIERATNQKITPMTLPSYESINQARVNRFKETLLDAIEQGGLREYLEILEPLQQEHDLTALDMAAALCKMLYANKPLQLQKEAKPRSNKTAEKNPRPNVTEPPKPERRLSDPPPQKGFERYRLEVGQADGAKVEHIVGAIANEAELDSEFIRNVAVHEDFATVDLPEAMPKVVYQILRRTRVAQKPLNLTLIRKKKARKPQGDSTGKFRSSSGKRPRPKKGKGADHRGKRKSPRH